MNDVRTKYAIFGFGRARFVLVRPPLRRYGYGSLLASYLVALRHASAAGLPVYFLTRRSEPAADLARMSSGAVRVIRPTPARAVVMWTLWGARLAWGHLRTPGRLRRTRLEALAAASRAFDRAIAALDRMHRALRAALVRASRFFGVRARVEPGAEMVRLHELHPRPDKVRVGSELARVEGKAEEQCRRLAAGLGIDPDAPIVTLHVREAGWRSGMYKSGELASHRVRNASIESYRRALRHLHESGVQVLRLGDPSMARFKAKGVFDLAHADGVTSLFELWAVARSEFMIGADSGPAMLTLLTGTPLLMVNSTNLVWGMQKPQDRFVCKHALRESGEPMSIAEMVAGRHIECRLAPSGEPEEAYRDNDEGDILDAVREMRAVVATPPGELQPTPSQLRYRELLAEHGFLRLVRGEGQICDGFARRWLGVDLGVEAHGSSASLA